MFELQFAELEPHNPHRKGQLLETLQEAQVTAEEALVAFRDYGIDDAQVFGQSIRRHQKVAGPDYARYHIVRHGPHDALEVAYEGYVTPIVICHTTLAEEVVKLSMLVLETGPHLARGVGKITNLHRQLIKLLKAGSDYALSDALACLEAVLIVMKEVGVQLRPKVADLVARQTDPLSFAECIRGLDRAFLTGLNVDYYLSELYALVVQRIQARYHPELYDQLADLLASPKENREIALMTQAYHLGS